VKDERREIDIGQLKWAARFDGRKDLRVML
jgi:hypothetical protein